MPTLGSKRAFGRTNGAGDEEQEPPSLRSLSRARPRVFWLRPWPRWGVLVACGALVGLTTVLDLATASEHHVYALYFLPVALAAWYGGRTLWIVIALLSTLLAVLTLPVLGMRDTTWQLTLSNLLTQAVAYGFIGALTERVRSKNVQDSWSLRHDALTSLLNKRGFRECLAERLKVVRRYGRTLTLAYVDLDNFKSVNDSRGHQVGDDVLGVVARVMRLCLRETDAAARVGGDEFAILLPETGLEGAQALLERVRATIEAEMRLFGCAVTASIGAVTFRTPPGTPADVLERADQQMYRVKREGKNRVEVVELCPSMGAPR
jgi:diguanylate cyclase (GGDEF)-like protein